MTLKSKLFTRRNHMKKILSVILLASGLLSLAACGSTGADTGAGTGEAGVRLDDRYVHRHVCRMHDDGAYNRPFGRLGPILEA